MAVPEIRNNCEPYALYFIPATAASLIMGVILLIIALISSGNKTIADAMNGACFFLGYGLSCLIQLSITMYNRGICCRKQNDVERSFVEIKEFLDKEIQTNKIVSTTSSSEEVTTFELPSECMSIDENWLQRTNSNILGNTSRSLIFNPHFKSDASEGNFAENPEVFESISKVTVFKHFIQPGRSAIIRSSSSLTSEVESELSARFSKENCEKVTFNAAPFASSSLKIPKSPRKMISDEVPKFSLSGYLNSKNIHSPASPSVGYKTITNKSTNLSSKVPPEASIHHFIKSPGIRNPTYISRKGISQNFNNPCSKIMPQTSTSSLSSLRSGSIRPSTPPIVRGIAASNMPIYENFQPVIKEMSNRNDPTGTSNLTVENVTAIYGKKTESKADHLQDYISPSVRQKNTYQNVQSSRNMRAKTTDNSSTRCLDQSKLKGHDYLHSTCSIDEMNVEEQRHRLTPVRNQPSSSTITENEPNMGRIQDLRKKFETGESSKFMQGQKTDSGGLSSKQKTDQRRSPIVNSTDFDTL